MYINKMAISFIVFFLLLTQILVVQSCLAENRSLVSKLRAKIPLIHGTLVIAMPIADGVLLMADRAARTIDGIPHEDDKITQIDKYTVVISTNASKKGYEGEKPIFSANDISTAILSSKNISGSIIPYLGTLGRALAQGFIDNNSPEEAERATALGKAGLVFQALLYHYDQIDGRFECPVIKVSYVPANSPSQAQIFWTTAKEKQPAGLNIEIEENKDADFSVAQIVPSGRIDFFYLLQSGHSPSFVSEDFKKHFIHHPPARDISLHEGLAVLTEAFVDTIKFERARGEDPIGTVLDSALLSPKTGFQWVWNKHLIPAQQMETSKSSF